MSEEPTSNGSVSESRPEAEEVRSAPPANALPKWEIVARERVRNAIKKFGKPLADLMARDANEGDTRLAVTDFLCEGLGYDKYVDLTTEYAVRGEFADYGVRIDKELVAFIEVKRIATKLNTKHLRQVQSYAVNEGVEWMILTNGEEWQAYHLTGGLPVVTELAFRVSLLGDETVAQKAKVLFYLTRESFKKRQIDELWMARRATSPESLGNILRSESVQTAIRRELWRQTRQRLEPEEMLRLLEDTVLRPECLGK